MGSSLLHFRLQPGNALFQTIHGFILRYAEGLFIILCVQLQLPLFGTAHRLGDNTVFPVVFFLNTPAVIRQLNQPFDGIRHHIRKQDALSIQMPRGAARRLHQGCLIAQKPLLVRIQNAHQGNLRQIQTFPKQVNAYQNVYLPGSQST